MVRPLLVVAFVLEVFGHSICAQGIADSTAFPPGFRPFVHLIGAAEVVATDEGPDWRGMDIKHGWSHIKHNVPSACMKAPTLVRGDTEIESQATKTDATTASKGPYDTPMPP